MKLPSDKPEATVKPRLRQMPGKLAEVSRETGTVPFRWMGDRGLLLATGGQTLAWYRRLQTVALPEVVELVPADGSLLVVLGQAGEIPTGLLDILNSHPEAAGTEAGQQHIIPVRFDGADLGETAAQLALPQTALVELLCSQSLGVKFLGFLPGFAYLEGLPPALHLPRRITPRKQVPAGSVALGGVYCGIYPAAGPGGWHLVGTTDAWLFDPAVNPPARFQPGDTVRLVSA